MLIKLCILLKPQDHLQAINDYSFCKDPCCMKYASTDILMVWSHSQVEVCGREETGDGANGRHYKRFYLQETDTNKDFLAVEGIDSIRHDRKCACAPFVCLAEALTPVCLHLAYTVRFAICADQADQQARI